MAYGNHLSNLQDDRLAREFPGDLQTRDPRRERLLPKLGVAVALGLVLAALGNLTDSHPGEDGIAARYIDTPETGAPQLGAISQRP